MAPHQRQCAHNRGRNRTLQKRRPRGTHTFAASTTNRDDRRSRHCYTALFATGAGDNKTAIAGRAPTSVTTALSAGRFTDNLSPQSAGDFSRELKSNRENRGRDRAD